MIAKCHGRAISKHIIVIHLCWNRNHEDRCDSGGEDVEPEFYILHISWCPSVLGLTLGIPLVSLPETIRNTQKHRAGRCAAPGGASQTTSRSVKKNAAVEWSICIHLYTYLTDWDFMNWKSVLQKGKTLSSYPQAKSVWLGSLSLIPLFPFCSDILEDFGLPLVETTEITRSPILPGDLSVAGSARSLVIGRSHTAPLLTANRWWKLWLAKMDRFSVLKPKPDSQFWTWTVLDVLDMVGPCCPIEFNTQLICLKVRSSKAHETL